VKRIAFIGKCLLFTKAKSDTIGLFLWKSFC
jgi:hypothetical protein